MGGAEGSTGERDDISCWIVASECVVGISAAAVGSADWVGDGESSAGGGNGLEFSQSICLFGSKSWSAILFRFGSNQTKTFNQRQDKRVASKRTGIRNRVLIRRNPKHCILQILA